MLYRDGKFVLYSLTDIPTNPVNGAPVEWSIVEAGDALYVGPYTLRFQASPE